MVKVGDVPEDEDEQLQLAIQKSLADQEDKWYYSSEEEVNEFGAQSIAKNQSRHFNMGFADSI
ncbi:hypothetical protein JCGZ_10593 [Jatropha curcas]|uniref:Uncharacterized protein n=1 Tax=Jatropha curcas TaxID=180498 RepID=A0A067JL62_JATCU|nr:hypothetical protein JCGZ_10593 [Jatropha curcas]